MGGWLLSRLGSDREWQQREREADEDLAADRVTRYESEEQFLGGTGRAHEAARYRGVRFSRRSGATGIG